MSLTPIQLNIVGYFLAEYRHAYSEECELSVEQVLDLARLFSIVNVLNASPERVKIVLNAMHNLQHE